MGATVCRKKAEKAGERLRRMVLMADSIVEYIHSLPDRKTQMNNT